MWECNYAREPFDLKLFCLHCLRRIWVLILGAVLGTLIIGGGYYLKNVTFGAKIPYTLSPKFHIEYGVDPHDTEAFSYFAGYTWNQWLRSDAVTERMLSNLPGMTREQLSDSFEAKLESDLRLLIITVKHVDKDMAIQIAAALSDAMENMPKEIKEIDKVDTIEKGTAVPDYPDIRTFRACILGLVVGLFAAAVGLGFVMIVRESIDLPATFTYRYHIPMLGYVDAEGKASPEVAVQAEHFFGSLKKEQAPDNSNEQIIITAVEEDLDLKAAAKAAGLSQAVCVPSLWQEPKAPEKLSEAAVLLAVKAGCGNGKRIEETLRQLEQMDIKVTAALLTEADGALIKTYYLGRKA